MAPRIPILLCFDVEPDDKLIDGKAEWAGMAPLVELLARYRPKFEVVTGRPCRFSWFLRMDPQVRELHGREDWVATVFERELRTLCAAGDEIGLHAHPWKRTPEGWVSEFGDAAWVEGCVRSSFEAYRRAFGKRCRSFRFGDRWMDQRTMQLLGSLGVRFDLTLEPGMTGFPISPYMEEIFLGERPDYTAVPRQPYRPSSTNYQEPGRWPRRMRLTEIPVSTAHTGEEIETLYLAADAKHVAHHIDRLLGEDATRHIALPARTDIAIRPNERDNLEATLDHFLHHPDRQRLHFATPADVPAA